MSTVSKPKIIIAALSSRVYVEAAVRAGYDVIAIDAFVDTDVKTLVIDWFQIDLIENQLDGDQLVAILDKLDLQDFVGFCYGAGFEKKPSVLEHVSERLPILGNMPSTIEQCKSPAMFFATCDQLQIPYPDVADVMPAEPVGWIVKQIGGSGGGHIKPLTDSVITHQAGLYYQKKQVGISISCLFIASNLGVDVIGINEQWLDENEMELYRYGGAVSQANVSQKAKSRLIMYVTQLAKNFSLIGINSCDAICDGNDVYVLEINPRLSATMDLYKRVDLMEKHLAARQQTLSASQMNVFHDTQTSQAHQIIYASHPLKLKNDIIWPDWVRDIPSAGAYFSVGVPVCTVIGQAETAPLAKALVADRARILKRKFLN